MAGERILIIENDPEFVESLLTNVLSPHGYLTQTTANGQAGLQAAQGERPDLVLLGLGLRDVSYAEVIEGLKAAGEPPIIALAPVGAEAEVLHAFRLGACDVLIQPVEAQEAVASIARVLYREQIERERFRLVRKLLGSNETLEQSLAETQTLYDIGKTLSSSLDLQDVLTAVVQAAVKLTHAQEGHLLLLSPEQDELYLRALQDLGDERAASVCARVDDGIAYQVLHTGEPVVLSSAGRALIKLDCRSALRQRSHMVRSLIQVPLCSQDRVMGVLGVDTVTSDKCFTQGDVMLLSALADSAAIAICNAQVHARTDQTLSCVLAEVSATRYKTDLILQNISEAVYTVDRQLRITSVNPAMEHITGWQGSKLLGRRYDEILAPESEGRRLSLDQTVPGRALCTAVPVGSTRSTILRQDNRRIPVIGTATPLKNADASLVGVLATMRDITAEEKLNHWRREMLETLRSQTLQLDPHTEDMLQTLRMNSANPSPYCHPVTLRPIISQIVQSFQDVNSGNSFQVTLAPDLPFAIGNESEIELALFNLIENALTLGAPEQSIRISADADERHVYVTVENPESGSCPDQQDHLQHYNDVRFSFSEQLLSLWATPQIKLYIASRLIQAQGGRVWTDNNMGTSTRFHLSLPKIEVQDVAQAFVD